jgi:acid phosphatase family membrane protein YuiD
VSLLRNPYFVIPLVAWALAQLSKVIVDSVTSHRFSVRRLATAGGMPSSHSALVVSLTTVIGKLEGVVSPLFAVCLIFSTVVMYDATGVRRAAGQQAIILNRLLDDLFIAHQGFRQERLRELLGHTPIEVIAGAALGFVVAWGLSPT